MLEQEAGGQFLKHFDSISPADEARQRNHANLLTIYGAIAAGDFEAAGAYLTDDVEMEILGMPSMAGRWRGRREVVAALRSNFSKVRDQKPSIEGLIGEGDSLALLLSEEGHHQDDGSPYRVRLMQWFTFEDGKIHRVVEIVAEA